MRVLFWYCSELPEDKPAIWRGPMVHKLIEQFLADLVDHLDRHVGGSRREVVDRESGCGGGGGEGGSDR